MELSKKNYLNFLIQQEVVVWKKIFLVRQF